MRVAFLLSILVFLCSFATAQHSASNNSSSINYTLVSIDGQSTHPCINVLDGRIEQNVIPKTGNESYFLLTDSSIISKFGFTEIVSCINFISTHNLPIEDFIYRQIQAPKLSFKIPIIVDNLYPSTLSTLRNLSKSAIRSIAYLPAIEAKEKYDGLLHFGVIEVTTDGK